MGYAERDLRKRVPRVARGRADGRGAPYAQERSTLIIPKRQFASYPNGNPRPTADSEFISRYILIHATLERRFVMKIKVNVRGGKAR